MLKRHNRARNKAKNPQQTAAPQQLQNRTSTEEEKNENEYPTIRQAAAIEKLAIERTRKNATVKKQQRKMSDVRTGKSNFINIQGIGVRKFATAEVTNRTQVVEQTQYKNNKSHKNFIDATGWTTIGKRRIFGPRISFQDGERETKVQFNPSRKQTGNFLIPSLGAYGSKKSKDILHIVNDLCKKDEKQERCLARCMLNALRKKCPLSEVLSDEFDKTSDEEIQIDDAFDSKLQAFFLLTTHLEVTRRHGPSVDNKGHKTRTLPMALALFLSLELVEAGKIRMDEVFGKDAKYGLPTGADLNSKKGFEEVEKKWNNLIEFYELHFKDISSENMTALEKLHQKYREYAGDESSNTSYTSKIDSYISRSTSSDNEPANKIKTSSNRTLRS